MSAPVLRLSVRPSMCLAITLAMIHAAAAACAVTCLPAWPAAGAVLPLAASFVFHLRRDALRRSPASVECIVVRADGSCELGLRGGDALRGHVDASSFVAPVLTVLNVLVEGRRRTAAVVLTPDSASAEDLRRLRVWLRHRLPAHAQPSGPL